MPDSLPLPSQHCQRTEEKNILSKLSRIYAPLLDSCGASILVPLIPVLCNGSMPLVMQNQVTKQFYQQHRNRT